MIIDANLLFFNNEAFSSAGESDAVDIGEKSVGNAVIRLFVTASLDSTSGATATFALSSADEEDGDYTTHYTTGAIADTVLAESPSVISMPLPSDCGQYVKLTVSGATVDGTLLAGLALDTAHQL